MIHLPHPLWDFLISFSVFTFPFTRDAADGLSFCRRYPQNPFFAVFLFSGIFFLFPRVPILPFNKALKGLPLGRTPPRPVPLQFFPYGTFLFICCLFLVPPARANEISPFSYASFGPFSLILCSRGKIEAFVFRLPRLPDSTSRSSPLNLPSPHPTRPPPRREPNTPLPAPPPHIQNFLYLGTPSLILSLPFFFTDPPSAPWYAPRLSPTPQAPHPACNREVFVLFFPYDFLFFIAKLFPPPPPI